MSMGVCPVHSTGQIPMDIIVVLVLDHVVM